MDAPKLLSVASVVAGITAAGLWFWAGALPIPDFTFHGDNLPKYLGVSGSLNKWAALATGTAILLDLIAKALRKEK
jgi:hypothetical protein